MRRDALSEHIIGALRRPGSIQQFSSASDVVACGDLLRNPASRVEDLASHAVDFDLVAAGVLKPLEGERT